MTLGRALHRDAPVFEDAEVLPAVFRPGTHETPDGPVEVSTATFADAVLARVPSEALFFRLGDVPGCLSGAPGSRRFVPLEGDGVRLLVDRSVRVTATRRDPETGDLVIKYCPCTKDLASLVLAEAKTSSRLRPLRAVVGHPVYLPGPTLAPSGYSAGAAIYYDEPEELRGVTPNAEGALAILRDVFAGFPFREGASEAAAVAFMLTLLLWPAVNGPRPLFLVLAHRERTGKTLLVRTLAGLVLGEEPPLMQLGTTEEEREKRIMSLILRGATVAVFDNLPAGEEIDSPALAMLATAGVYAGRRLGRSENLVLPNSLTVVMTGNNVGASGEIANRILPIFLAARTARPEEETGFPHEEDGGPVAYARSRRREGLAALLGLVEAWKASGCPPCRDVPFGGFNAWVETVGGILRAGGADGFGANLRAWRRQADEFTTDAEALLSDWYREELHGRDASATDVVTASALLARAERLGVFGRHRLAPSETGRLVEFARRVLGVLEDRIFDVVAQVGNEPAQASVRLNRGPRGKRSVYRLEVLRGASSSREGAR